MFFIEGWQNNPEINVEQTFSDENQFVFAIADLVTESQSNKVSNPFQDPDYPVILEDNIPETTTASTGRPTPAALVQHGQETGAKNKA